MVCKKRQTFLVCFFFKWVSMFASFLHTRLKYVCLHSRNKVRLPRYPCFNGTIETTTSCCQTTSPQPFSHITPILVLNGFPYGKYCVPTFETIGSQEGQSSLQSLSRINGVGACLTWGSSWSWKMTCPLELGNLWDKPHPPREIVLTCSHPWQTWQPPNPVTHLIKRHTFGQRLIGLDW